MSSRSSPALRAVVVLGDVVAVLAAFVVALQVRAAGNGLLEAVWPSAGALLKPFGAPSHLPLLPLVLAVWGLVVAVRLPAPSLDGRDLVRSVARVTLEAAGALAAALIALGIAEATSRAFVLVLAGAAGSTLLAWRSAVTALLRAEHGADPARRVADRAVKRLIDVAGASAGLVVALPIVVAAAVAIRLWDGGPALFAQDRCGRFGRTFRMFKLRTMVVGAEALPCGPNDVDGPAFKRFSDPRITPVGAVLRRWSIDEIPQLWNVIRGEMSLVGPRPALPDEVAACARWQLRRLAVLPGLTGAWQVSGRSLVPFRAWMRLDRDYVQGWSLRRDAQILLRTLPVVLSGRGAA